MWPRSKIRKTADLLAPFTATHANELILDGDVWKATGLDPFIIYKLDPAVSTGPLLIDLDLEILEGRAYPRIYFKVRGSYGEHASELMRRTGVGRYKLYAYLPRSCDELRLDPAETHCVFRIRMFTVTQATPMTFIRRAMRGGANYGEVKPSIRRLWSVMRRSLRNGITFERVDGGQGALDAGALYEKWIELHDYAIEDRPLVQQDLDVARAHPRFSVLMPVYNTPREVLDAAIDSVVKQTYGNWELCIANDASTSAWIAPLLDEWAARDERIKVVHRPVNGHIAQATNSAFEISTGEFIALLDHDDLLREHALAEVVLTLSRRPDAQVIYSDEDKIDDSGRRYDPFFKPEWNPDLFLAQNYLNHLTVHRRANIAKVGGWREAFNGSQDYDINLRIIAKIDPRTIVHIPKILYHWRSTAQSMAQDESSKNYAVVSAIKALETHVKTKKLKGDVEQIPETNWYRIKYHLPAKPPLVSLIIPTRNGLDILRTCIDSIRTKTTYPNYEIIVVDNDSDDPAAIEYLQNLALEPWARVLPYPYPFNYSAINNFAVARAKGQVIGLINNDIEVISPEWLTEMVSLALRPGVGCVGAKLYYPNNTIQHAGVIIGLGGVAGHSHKRFDRKSRGYFGRLLVTHNVSAVTAACLVVKKKVYDEVGGLDAENLTVAFNDVDFCLKVLEHGYRNVWTPFAELYHHESVSRGSEDDPVKRARFMSEIQFMKGKWGQTLTQDSTYSPNLTKKYEDFSINLDAGG